MGEGEVSGQERLINVLSQESIPLFIFRVDNYKR